ncbi:hypothetical protein [Streptomyces antibioticus]|uniref:hypothetical protein n=1 Tax=Streptomyces antibioticus TaxID=1890 RepID=UPI003F451184
MTDNLIPQTLAPNALILGELKPSAYMRWIDLAMDLGPLDYKAYKWEELQERWSIGKKPVQTMVRTLEAAGWLSSESTRDGVRIYLFPTNDAAESHLKRIRQETDDSWKMNNGKKWKVAHDKQPYRNRFMVEKGNFTKVPETILRDQRFTNMQLGAYMVIRCTTNGGSFWGERALAKAAGMAPSTFAEHLKTLKDAGYVAYDGVQRVSNRYDFNDMPESLSVQMESLSVQPEPVSVQMESLSVPINTEYNTEERILNLNTNQSGAAAGKEDQGSPLASSNTASGGVAIPGEVAKEVGVSSGDVVDAPASPAPGETKKSRASFIPKSRRKGGAHAPAPLDASVSANGPQSEASKPEAVSKPSERDWKPLRRVEESDDDYNHRVLKMMLARDQARKDREKIKQAQKVIRKTHDHTPTTPAGIARLVNYARARGNGQGKI